MIVKQQQFEINEEFSMNNLINKDRTLFFDIETTGFSSINTNLYLIGCMYIDKGTCFSIQWLSEEASEEELIISRFFEYIKNFKTIIHFNGSIFDIPYIEDKCKRFNLPYNFNNFKSIDIYRKIRKLKNIFKLDNLKQKTIEEFLDIQRTDLYSGKELINVYYNYVQTRNESDLSLLINHNFEDIYGMVRILDIISYYELFNGNYTVSNIDLSKNKEIIFNISLNYSVPRRYIFEFDSFFLWVFEDKAYINVKINRDELKYFYPNYKDYYYLPLEDTSIHKSVAFYVDREFRTKAKASNCYSKKSGSFLPQYDEIVSPSFKESYKDKKAFFEVTDDFLSDSDLIKSYTLHILNLILNNANK